MIAHSTDIKQIITGLLQRPPKTYNRNLIPCQVDVFARMNEFDSIKLAIARGGLVFSEPAVEKEKNIPKKKSVDDIFQLWDLKIRCQGAVQVLEPPKGIIKSELFSHQKEGLGWLVSRENSCELPPFWDCENELTNLLPFERPEPIRGGIFADDMGLGKTLTLLSLIALDKCAYSRHPCGNVDAEIDEEQGEENEMGKLDTPCDSLEPRTTLIVFPRSIYSSWVTQLEEHTTPGGFNVFIYYGEKTNTEELQKYDIVLTTYRILASEYNGPSPIQETEWRRVILDEAHVIKNEKNNQSRVATNLKAKRRWAVTSTPIQNNTSVLFSLMAFLKFEPFSIENLWNYLIELPHSQRDEKVFRLQVLMASMSLRRTKEKCLVGLPSRSIETYHVILREEEREKYDQMEGEARQIVQGYISDRSMVINYSTILGILMPLRQICTDLALCPADLPPCKIVDAKNNPTLLEKLLLVLEDGEDFECPICISPPTDVVITCCAHIFCRACILKTIKVANTRGCPLCRHPLSESDLFKAPSESQTNSTGDSSLGSSSKVAALLQLLTASRDASPSTKSVIFSQFRKMLVLLEEHLKKAGLKVLRLDDSWNAKRMAQVIKKFGVPAPQGPTILLASLRSTNAGISAASKVYLMEPSWNPEVEEQVVNRVHRMGQKEDLKIVRLIAINTIEERILQLQEKKKQLAMQTASGDKGPEGLKKITREDLLMLMNL
ncbi:hypothetical protein Pfo_000967 [Paulownia fortunei]|nr:hypothetical protein Pfo_000967 [Paulownia fortunei]